MEQKKKETHYTYLTIQIAKENGHIEKRNRTAVQYVEGKLSGKEKKVNEANRKNM